MASDNLSAVQPSANPVPDTAVAPGGASNPSVTDLGVNEATNIASFPTIGGGRDASMTIEQPAGGPIVDGQAGPN